MTVQIHDRHTGEDWEGETVDAAVRAGYGEDAVLEGASTRMGRVLIAYVTRSTSVPGGGRRVLGEVTYDASAPREDAVLEPLVASTRDRERQAATLAGIDEQWRQDIRDALAQGYSLAEVAAVAGVTRARVAQIRDGRR